MMVSAANNLVKNIKSAIEDLEYYRGRADLNDRDIKMIEDVITLLFDYHDLIKVKLEHTEVEI